MKDSVRECGVRDRPAGTAASRRSSLQGLVCEDAEADAQGAGDLDGCFQRARPFGRLQTDKLAVVNSGLIGQRVQTQARLLPKGSELSGKPLAKVSGLALGPLVGDTL